MKKVVVSKVISIIDLLNDFSDILQNLLWLVGVVVLIYALFNGLFSITRKSNKYTRRMVNWLIKNGKYIPGVFIELNDSKEILRYFVYGEKWKRRIIKSFKQ